MRLELTHGTVRLDQRLETDEDGPEEDIGGDVLGNRKLLHSVGMGEDRHKISKVECGGQIVVLILVEVYIDEHSKNRAVRERVLIHELS